MTTRALDLTLLACAAGIAGCPAADVPEEDLSPPVVLADLGPEADQAPVPRDNVILVLDTALRPVAGVDVVVNDRAGAVVRTDKTGADGQVTVLVPEGGLVSVFQTDGRDRYIDAVAEPPPGVRLTFTSYALAPPGRPPTQLELRLTGVPAGATQVRFYSGCSSGTQGTDIPILKLPACEVLGKYDVIAVATDDAGKRLGWGAVLAQDPRPGQLVTGDLPLDQIPFATIDLEITGVSAGRRGSIRLLPRGDLVQRLPTLTERLMATSPPQGSLRAPLTLPAASREGYRTIASASHDLPETAKNTFYASVSRGRYHQTLPAQASEAIDGVPEVRLADPDLTDAAHPRYGWQLSAPFRGDGGVLIGQYDTGQGWLYWFLQFPAGRAPDQRMPAIPPALRDYELAKTARHAYGQVTYHDYDGLNGYADYLDDGKVAASPGYTTSLGTFTKKP